MLALVAAFILVNTVSLRSITGLRLDATQDGAYTLTTGSRNIARSPDEPLTLTFYYSPALGQGRPEIDAHARRVRELLEEYARISQGKIRLSIINPEPFSDAEDTAAQQGLIAVPAPGGGSLFLGLVGVNALDGREIIPFFDPRKERFLEYEISRLVHALANPKRTHVGLITSLPMEGGFAMDPRTRQPTQTPPWQIIEEIKGLFTLTRLDNPSVIPEDVDILMVVHPKDLAEQTLFAIDQFVLRGGRLLLCLDPRCEGDDAGQQFGAPGTNASNLSRLLDAWGVEMPAGMLAADDVLAKPVFTGTRNNPEITRYVVILGAGETALSSSDPVTSSLTEMVLGTPGYFRVKEGAADPLTITPIISTSPTAMEMPAAALGTQPQPKELLKQFKPGTHALVMGARFTGRARTAFPEGRPAPSEGEPAPLPDSAPALSESKGDVNIIAVADCDFLADAMWMRASELFGSRVMEKLSSNADFVLSALDNLAGSDDLITVRARRESARPFKVVEDMQRRAEQRHLAEEDVLKASLAETEARIRDLEAKKDGAQGSLVLSPEQRAEVEKFRAQAADTRKQLREVRRKLNADIDSLGKQLKFINTALVPLLVAILAVGLGFFRRARRSKAARGTP